MVAGTEVVRTEVGRTAAADTAVVRTEVVVVRTGVVVVRTAAARTVVDRFVWAAVGHSAAVLGLPLAVVADSER